MEVTLCFETSVRTKYTSMFTPRRPSSEEHRCDSLIHEPLRRTLLWLFEPEDAAARYIRTPEAVHPTTRLHKATPNTSAAPL
jgi:hypothetical protein